MTLVSLVTYNWSPPVTYAMSFKFNVGLEPMPPTGTEYQYNPLDTWQASEYLMDDLASAARGAAPTASDALRRNPTAIPSMVPLLNAFRSGARE